MPNRESKIYNFNINNKSFVIQTNENFNNFGNIESCNLNTHQNRFLALLKKVRNSISSLNENSINP